MPWTRQGLWKGRTQARVDIKLAGLDRGEGRNKDRLETTAGTRDRKVYDRRVAMLRTLHERGRLDALRALYDDSVTIDALERATWAGSDAIDTLLASTVPVGRLAALVGEYLQQHEGSAKSDIEDHLNRFLEWLGPARSTIEALTAENINAFLAQLTNQNAKDKTQAVSGGTRNRYRCSVQGLCSWLVLTKRMVTSPFFVRKNVKAYTEKTKESARLPEMKAVEIHDYLAAIAERYDDAYRMLLWAHIETGADAGEFLNDGTKPGMLTVRHVHFAQGNGLTRLQFIRSKTLTRGATERFVPVTAEFSEALKAHIERFELKGDDLVFGMCEYNQAYNVHFAACKAIGRKGVSRKDLRHVAAIRWRRSGADLEQIRSWLGHSRIEQTRKYAAFLPDDEFDSPVIQKMRATYNAPQLRRTA